MDDLSKVKKMSRARVAYMLNVTPTCITQWRETQGLPFNRDAAGKITYNMRDVAKWNIERAFAKLGRKRPEPETVTCLADAEDFIRKNYPSVKLP